MAGIYQRGSTWWARAQRQGTEHRRSLKTRDKREAEKRLRHWLADLDAIAWGDKPRRSFDDAVRKFYAEHLPTMKRSSAIRYGVSLKWLSDHFEGKGLDQISSAALSEFETARRSAGASAPTVRRDLACLSSLLTSCEDWEWIDDGKNPVPSYLRRRRKRGLKEAPARTRYLTLEEEQALLAKSSPTVAIAVALAIDTGLRREELFSLTWAQVDLARGIIATTTDTKSGKTRMVPVAQRSAQAIGALPRHIRSPYVLWQGSGARYVQMNKGFKAACRRAGLSDVRWHDLRRTAGCRWLQRDRRSMEEVCGMLGHSSVQVTETRYAFLDGETVAQETAQMAAQE
jgi:integrase